MDAILRWLSSLVLAGLAVHSICAQPAQPWAGAAVTDWANASNAIVLTDLSRCEPNSALSDMVLRKKRWKVIPYTMLNGYSGKMIWAPPEANAPELSFTPELEGWHAVFVGLFAVVEAPTIAWLRLEGDPASVPRSNQRTDYGNSEEVFFRVVYLRKGSKLQFRPQTTGEVSPCGITHVKLIPLSADEVRRHETDQKSDANRTLAATSDGFSDMFHRSPRTKAALLSQVEIFRDTDFGTLILQAPGADKLNYPSKTGFLFGSRTEVFPRVGDRHFVESTRALAAQKINPFKTQIERAHEIGMKVHVGIRPAGWDFFEPYSDYWQTSFYQKNPQWRCEDRDGTPVTRMSWAVPEVRQHLIEVLRELVQFGADGAHLVFTRGYPLVLYEPPARNLFQKQHGLDPRQVPESDPRITQFRSDIVTKFFEELRAMLDEEQRLRGAGRLALSVMINGTAQDDLTFGVDLRRLASAKLVDAVFTEHGFGTTTKTLNLQFLREVCDAQKIPFSPGIYNRGTQYGAVLPEFFANGAQGVAVWDAEITDMFEWCWVSRIGHVEETQWRLKNLDLKKAPRTVHYFQKLGNQVRNGRFGPHWGG